MDLTLNSVYPCILFLNFVSAFKVLNSKDQNLYFFPYLLQIYFYFLSYTLAIFSSIFIGFIFLHLYLGRFTQILTGFYFRKQMLPLTHLAQQFCEIGIVYLIHSKENQSLPRLTQSACREAAQEPIPNSSLSPQCFSGGLILVSRKQNPLEGKIIFPTLASVDKDHVSCRGQIDKEGECGHWSTLPCLLCFLFSSPVLPC